MAGGPVKPKRSVFKKSGGLRQRMVVHYVPKGGSLTMCSRSADGVFFNDQKDHKRIGCKVCLRALQ